MPASLVSDLYRYGEHNGEYTRLDWSPHEKAAVPSTTSQPRAEIDQLIEGIQCSPKLSKMHVSATNSDTNAYPMLA